MKLPYFASWDKTPIVVTLTDEGIDENGAPQVLATYDGYCNWTNKTKTVRSPDGQFANLGGVLTIKGDIAPEIPSLIGFAKVEGKTRNIFSGEKVRNPDGSVNHTYLELL